MNVDIRKLTNMMCEKELNQRQLAQEAGISETTVTAIMKNGSVKIVTLGKIAKCFECNPGELVRI